MTDDDVCILKKFYSVETDLELIEAQHHHIEKLQDSITSVKWADVAVRVKPRLAVVAFALLLLAVGVAQAEPIAQMPLSEFKGLIVRVDKLQQREKLQAELIGHLQEKDKLHTDYIAKIETANETIQAYATKLEEHNARLEQHLADRPIDWVLVAEVAATTLTARWGGGHVWRWGKALMGRR